MARSLLLGRAPRLSICSNCIRLLRTNQRQVRYASQAHSDFRVQFIADGRNRVSNFWPPFKSAPASSKPKGGESQIKKTNTKASAPDREDVHSLLIRAGFLRNAYPGVFHMLPLGLRVQEKLEKLIDKNMKAIGALKVALPSISSRNLWDKTGRAEKMGKELIQFQDRHNTNYLLGPTHEEEITQLVASTVYSHKQLPLRLYQITRKFRDERRPRAGLLRGREFLMKDLYTFDNGTHGALSTYEAVKSSYKSIFDTLGLPYLVSEADSGAMGGNLSHEYHYPCSTGEDTVLHCADTDGCGYTANMECVGSVPAKAFGMRAWKDKRVWYGVSKDRKVLIRAIYPGHVRKIGKDGDKEEWIKREVNPSEVQKIIGEDGGGLDMGMEEATALNLCGQHFTPWADALDHTTGQALRQYSRVIKLYDQHLIDGDGVAKRTTFSDHEEDFDALSSSVIQSIYTSKKIPTIVQTSSQNSSGDEVRLSLLKPTTGDTCPKCKTADLTATTTTELGHTFFLGTRYSEPLQARSHSTDAEGNQQLLPIQMGCYGIGVSRLIAAIAEVMRDDKGLCWPKVIAPYSVAIIGVSPNEEMRAAIEGVYDDVVEGCCEGESRFLDEEDVIMDDRLEKFGFKISEADAIGYSVVVVVGRKFEDGFVELQERRTGEKVEVSRGELIDKLRAILR